MEEAILTIAAFLGALGVIGGFFYAIHKVLKRFEKLEEDNTKREQTDKILLEGLWASLDGLHQLKCNGVVTETLDKLKKHIINN